jgi:NAD(P)-dependent dehydrogenase (short-subunit alcohol dehydrogenase family)
MLLNGRTAIVYGAGGPVGSAVASAYAREGAVVHLAGRTREPLDRLASTIREAGGTAHVATVDALDHEAVKAHAEDVATNGGIDIAFNATANDDVQGTDLADLPFEEFMRPITKSVTAHHHIATAVAQHMKSGRGGTILVMAGGREAIPALGGAHVAWSALTGLCRQLAAEFGPDHIRVAWLLSPGSPDEPTPAQPRNHGEGGSDNSSQSDPDAAATLLGRRPSYDDIGNAAAFFSSDWARTMTATELNLTAGAVVD